MVSSLWLWLPLPFPEPVADVVVADDKYLIIGLGFEDSVPMPLVVRRLVSLIHWCWYHPHQERMPVLLCPPYFLVTEILKDVCIL